MSCSLLKSVLQTVPLSGIGTRWFLGSLPTQNILCFYDSLPSFLSWMIQLKTQNTSKPTEYFLLFPPLCLSQTPFSWLPSMPWMSISSRLDLSLIHHPTVPWFCRFPLANNSITSPFWPLCQTSVPRSFTPLLQHFSLHPSHVTLGKSLPQAIFTHLCWLQQFPVYIKVLCSWLNTVLLLTSLIFCCQGAKPSLWTRFLPTQ